jgi:hypothetical protein
MSMCGGCDRPGSDCMCEAWAIEGATKPLLEQLKCADELANALHQSIDVNEVCWSLVAAKLAAYEKARQGK